MKFKEQLLTTKDNPYDPFDDFVNWYMFDVEHKYFTCEVLARLAGTSENLTDQENQYLVEEAMKDMIKNDFEDKYVIVTKEVEEPKYEFEETENNE